MYSPTGQPTIAAFSGLNSGTHYKLQVVLNDALSQSDVKLQYTSKYPAFKGTGHY